MSKKDNQTTFEAFGVHPAVCAALSEKSVLHPQPLQRQTLQHTTIDFADIIAEASSPRSGRHTLMCVFAAHCVLSAVPKSNVVLIANSNTTASKIMATFQHLLSSTRVAVVPCLDDRPPKGPNNAVGSVYVGTLSTFALWDGEAFSATVTLIVEDCHAHDAKQLQGVIDAVIQVSPETNLFFLSSVSPSEVSMSIRYLLRRKNRRYYFQENTQPNYSYLLCHDAEDRAALNLKLTQLEGLKSILVLTHNREVRDLKAHLHQMLGVKTFSIQRNTTPDDHDRILSEFLRSQYAVLIAMDAYTGVDLMDVDAVIQYYPPQKSMPEEEWAEYVSYLKTTGDPRRPTLISTLVAPDDFSLVSYFMRRTGAEGPVINVSPTHPQFQAAVFDSNLVAQVKMRLESGHVPNNSSGGTSPTVSNPSPAPLSQQDSGKHPQGARTNSSNRGSHFHPPADDESTAASSNSASAIPGGPVPLPRSHRASGREEETNYNSSNGGRGGGGGGGKNFSKQQSQEFSVPASTHSQPVSSNNNAGNHKQGAVFSKDSGKKGGEQNVHSATAAGGGGRGGGGGGGGGGGNGGGSKGGDHQQQPQQQQNAAANSNNNNEGGGGSKRRRH